MIDFYKYLYTGLETCRPIFELLDFPKVSWEEKEWSERNFTKVEVLQIIKQCDGEKAQGPDGLPWIS